MSDYSTAGNRVRQAGNFQQSQRATAKNGQDSPGSILGYDTTPNKSQDFDVNEYKQQAIEALGEGADPAALATYAANAARADGFGGQAYPTAANDLKAAFGLDRSAKLIDDGSGDAGGVWSKQKLDSFVNSFKTKPKPKGTMTDYGASLAMNTDVTSSLLQ
jgi:hypothetical protein